MARVPWQTLTRKLLSMNRKEASTKERIEGRGRKRTGCIAKKLRGGGRTVPYRTKTRVRYSDSMLSPEGGGESCKKGKRKGQVIQNQ